MVVTEDMRNDLGWFIQFLVRFNGQVLCLEKRQKVNMYVDASPLLGQQCL